MFLQCSLISVCCGLNSQQKTMMNAKSALGNFSYFLSIIILCGLFRPAMLFAQSDTTKANQLNEVQIKAKRYSEILSSPTPMQILGGSDLKRLNSLSVADALRYFSGVQLKDYGGIGGLKTINVRSMGSNHTNVFYNGIQFGNAQNGQVDLGELSLDNLEEITLLNGQNAELLQTAKAYASASGLLLKAKVPSFNNGRNYNLATSLKTGSFGLFNSSINYQQKLNKNIDLGISTEFTNANGKYKFKSTNGVYDTTIVRDNTDVERFRFEASLFGKLKNQGKWYAQAYSFFAERGLPGANVANRYTFSQRVWDKNLFAQGNVQYNFSEKFSILLNAKTSYKYTRYLDPDYITIFGFLDNRYHEREAYFSAAGQYKITKDWQVSVSSDYQYQDLKANLYLFAYPHRNTFLNAFASSYKTTRLNLQANILSTTVSDKVEIYDSGGNKQVFSPTIMFSYQLLPETKLRLRGFYKDIFRMPTFNDLYYTLVGNTRLNPEYAKQYNLGITYIGFAQSKKFLPLEVQGDIYYNRIKDKIIAQPGANLLRWTMFNIDRVDIKGLEANIKSGFIIHNDIILATAINYTYQKAFDATNKNDEYYGHQIPYIPKHSGSFLAKLDYKDFKLNYSFIYTGERYNQKANILENHEQPWYTHDVGLGYDFRWKLGIVGINWEVNNILNQYYNLIANFPLPGRNYRFTLSYSI
jgi:vitamin B12 transporter